MKKYFWKHHAWKSQNPKMTKIGDRFIVDISKKITFSGMFVWNFQNHLLEEGTEPKFFELLHPLSSRPPSLTQKVSSGTTMRRACELVARRAYCVELQKNRCVYVRSSVRPLFVRPSHLFLDPENGPSNGGLVQKGVPNVQIWSHRKI